MAVAFLPPSLRHQWVSCSNFMKTGKPTAHNAKVTFGNRKKGRAVKRPNKRTSVKPSRGQG